MTAGKPLEFALPIRRMLELERAEKIVRAMARGELPGLTDDELKEKDAPLFDHDPLTLEGWRRDHNRSWVPPDLHAIDHISIKGKDRPLQPRPASGSGSGTPRSSTTAQKLAELTPVQFRGECQAIRNDELRKRWAHDRESWIHRWDRRADLIERWGRRQLP